ncbi:MAG: hypothetical protein EPO21_15325 [Chloroflexota bacterium]|nr:MAG: hypothetical protein EPO21_15325 [Chloroflexota bacterium]
MSKYTIGLDLGQAQDFSAIAIVERVGDKRPFSYHLGHLQRYQLHTSYPTIVEQVTALLWRDPLPNQTTLVIDQTGVGAPVLDLFRRRRRGSPLALSPSSRRPAPSPTLDNITASIQAIHITSGTVVNHDKDTGVWNVPKRDLVSTAAVLLQESRLRIAKELPEAQTLVDELLNFQVKITDSGHDTYGAWREGTHDDLVLAVALACWWAERTGGGSPRLLSVPFRWVG